MLLDGPRHGATSTTSRRSRRAMNAAATQDLRSVALTPVAAARCCAPRRRRARARRGCSSCCEAWRAAGSSRLDRDLDGVMDAGPGPAIWDAFYPRLCDGGDAGHGPRRRSIGDGLRAGAAGFTDGGFWYLDKDLRRLNGERFAAPFKRALLRRRRPRARARAAVVGGAGGRARATRTRCARTRRASGSRSGPGCCRRRSATRTARAASSR